MHDSTMQMNSTTSRLARTSDDMHTVMCQILDTGRQGASLDLRNKTFENVLNSPKLEDKGTAAGLYFLAFEYQIWSKDCEELQPGMRDRLMLDAVDEFFRRLVGITHWVEVDPFAGKNPLKFGEGANEQASFNALAASMERTNRKGEASASRTGSETLSMLKMIETSLRAGKQIKEGKAKLKDFPAYVDLVLSREELATRLLKARYQTMGLAVLGYLTPITRNSWEGFKYKYLGQKWDLDFNEMNESQVRVAIYRLEEALYARDILAELGVSVKLDSDIQRIFSHSQVKHLPGEAGATVAESRSELARAQQELVAKMKDYAGE